MKYYARVGDRELVFTFERRGDQLLARVNGNTYRLDLAMVGDGSAFSLLVDHRSVDVIVESAEGCSNVLLKGETIRVRIEDERERTASEVAGARTGGKRTINASMPGVVVDVLVAVGDEVEDGQTLLILEAMKMQNPIQAEGAGTVAAVHVQNRDTVSSGAKLVDLE